MKRRTPHDAPPVWRQLASSWPDAAPTVRGGTASGVGCSSRFPAGAARHSRTNDVVVGGLVCGNALLAIVLAAHVLRWVNLALGLWLIAAPWPLGFGWTTMGQRLLVGILLASTALVPSRSPRTPPPARD